MAPQVVNDFVSLIRAHPVIFGGVLILFTPPFFPIVKFFSPLLISTALFMLALFTMGPGRRSGDDDEDRELLEERGDGDGEKVSTTKPDGGWKDWVKSIEESSLTWMSSSSPRASKHTNDDNWKHGVLNDENVSILEEASWMSSKGADYTSLGEDGSSSENNNNNNASNNVGHRNFMPTLMAPSALFKVDSDLQACAVERAIIYDDNAMTLLGEDAPPELEDVVEPAVGAPHHQLGAPIESSPPATADEQASEPHSQPAHQPLQIPVSQAAEIVDSPTTDIDDDSPAVDNNSRRLLYANVRRGSVNASSGLSDVDTPVAANLSLSGKFQQLEKLGEFLDAAEQAEHAGQESPKVGLLQPSTADQVDDVKDHLESFVVSTHLANHSVAAPNPNHEAAAKSSETASHPLDSTTATEMRKQLSSDSASSDTVLLSDSDSELEIFPSADDPAKMKLHPPLKLGTATNPVATHA